jgi:polysaccharide biosynthesis/export protein
MKTIGNLSGIKYRGTSVWTKEIDGIFKTIAVALGCVALGGCAPEGGVVTSSPATKSMTAQTTQTVADSSSPNGEFPTGVGLAEYRIKSDDILQVVVYQVPDFSRDAQVDTAGNIVLPLLGAIPAAKRTVRELEADLTQRLKAKYIQNPQVSVSVKDAVGLRVTVSGAVVKPGVLPVRGNVTLMSAISQSDGFSDTADKSSIIVIRNTDSGRAIAHFNAEAILAGKEVDPIVYGGDTIVVNESGGKVAWKNLGTVMGVATTARLVAP